MAKSVKSKKQDVPSNQRVSDTTTSEQPVKRSEKIALSGWPMLIGWLAMLIFTFHACTHMVAAGDTWVAMACGRHFVKQGVDTVEPFSAHSHKAGPTEEEIKTWPNWAQWITNKVGTDTVKKWHPTGWINQNWLTHVIFYKLVPESSYADGVSFTSNALVYWKFAIYIITVICVYYTSRLLGVNPALAAVFACFAMFIGRSFLDVRPAGFSNMLVAVFLFVLALTTYRSVLFIWLIVPVAVFWCNVHGGYIYVFIMLVPFVIWHLLMLLPKKWTLSLYCFLAWNALYGLAYKFTGHELLTQIRIYDDWYAYLSFLLICGSISITIGKRTKKEVLYSYHIIASVIVFLSLLPRFFPEIPKSLSPLQLEEFLMYISSARLSFVVIFIFIVILMLTLIVFKDRIVFNINLKGILHVISAGFVAFLAVILFNPFHLTNLTHTFVISVSEHAARWRQIHEWQPAFDWGNPVGTAKPFLVMYIIAWLGLVVWCVVLIRSSRPVSQRPKRKAKDSDVYHWPKIDLSLMLIAALTIYMAIRSRRFIPVAAIAGCPIIALFIDQVIRAISAEQNFRIGNSMSVPPMPHQLQVSFTIAGAVAVLFFGTWWGLKFKHVYLEPWPNDPKYSSAFMRMTASDAKPFYAMKFVRDNKLSGKMLNYWTEGGFIAWGQEPDPNTGRTPLRLFMDGRAQAAYDRRAFDQWSYIMSGGPIAFQILQRTQARGQVPTTADYRQIGKWMDQQLKSYDVWSVLMPSAVYNDPDRNNYYHATRGIENDPNWPLVFFNNKQRVYVNIQTPRGKELFEGIFTGKTIYPDEFHKNLIRAHSWLMYYRTVEQKKEGLKFAIEAFNAKPSPAPMLEIILLAARLVELRPDISKFCSDYVSRFEENKEKWSKEDGYRHKVEAARLACFHLMQDARSQGNTKLVNSYAAKQSECVDQLVRMTKGMKW